MARNLHPVHFALMKALVGLGAALRELRERRDLTQVELAAKSGLGQNQVSRYEREEEWPSTRSLSAILDGLGFELYDLAHALDQVNGREPLRFPGTARPEWVAALVHRGLSRDTLWGFAIGARERRDSRAGDDFVASVEAAARELAREALEEAETSIVAEPSPDEPPPAPRKPSPRRG